MLSAVVVTLAFLPFYLLLRAPFSRLPLHIDTGFYVANHTIATGRIDFSKGWNAHFAGCSKVLPEYFYSLIYLLHGRRVATAGPYHLSNYKRLSRLYVSLYNYLTAIVVGILAYHLAGSDVRFFYAGLVLFALISSEPQYGVFFECGELFGLLGNVVAITMLVVGLEQASALWIGAAVFVWASEACFVKLSSAIVLVMVVATVLWRFPASWASMLVGGSAAIALYVAWILANGRNPWALVRALAGHEISYGQRADSRMVAHRMLAKLGCLVRTIRRQPLIPVLAVVGAVVAPPSEPLVWVYLCAAFVAYAVQAANCWYYQIPLLPPVVLIASGAVVILASSGAVGVGILVSAGALWIANNTLRGIRLRPDSLNVWCWNGNLPADMVSQDLTLEVLAEEIRAKVVDKTLLVYGPFSQAYVLLGASYSTPIITPEYYLDEICPGWQRTLSAQLVASPPAFILDTANSFAAAATREALCLDYRLTHVYAERFRLFQLRGTSKPLSGFELTDTYRPQSERDLGIEEELAPPDLVVHPKRWAGQVAGKDGRSDVEQSALSSLLEELAERGYRRLALYGAGRFTIRHADVYRRSPVPVTVVLDDKATGDVGRFLDWPLCLPAAANAFGVDAIVVSSDRFAGPMLTRVGKMWQGRIAVFSVNAGRTAAATDHAPEKMDQEVYAASDRNPHQFTDPVDRR